MKKVFILGSISIDMVMVSNLLPNSGETVLGSDFYMNQGGKGANQAIALAKLGVTPIFIGAIGDNYSEELTHSLNAVGVDIRYLSRVNKSTGIASILILDHDNRIVVYPGANHSIKLEDVKLALSEASSGDIFLTQAECDLDLVAESINLAKNLKLTVLLNNAPGFDLTSCYQNVDYLFLNEVECYQLTGIKVEDDISVRLAFKTLERFKLKRLIVTLGDKGAIYIDNDLVLHQEAIPIVAIDSTAAGDAFVGAFCQQLIKGQTIEANLRFSSAVGALTCLKKGASMSMPTAAEVMSFLEEKYGK